MSQNKQFLPQFAVAMVLSEDWGYEDDQRISVTGEIIAGGDRLGVAGQKTTIVFAAGRTQAVERTLEKSELAPGSVVLIERAMRGQDGIIVAEWVRTITAAEHDARTVIAGYAASPVVKLPNMSWTEGEPESIRWPLALRTLVHGDKTFDRAWLSVKVAQVAEMADQAARDLKIALRKKDAGAIAKAKEKSNKSRITVTTDLLRSSHALVVKNAAEARAAITGALAVNMGFAVLRHVGGFPGEHVRINRAPNQTTDEAIEKSAMGIAKLFETCSGTFEVIPGQVIAAMAMLKTGVIGDLKAGAGLKLAEIERVWDKPEQLASLLLPVQELTKTAAGAYQLISLPVPAEPERFALEGLPSPSYHGKNLKHLPYTTDSGFHGENAAVELEAA